MAVRADSVAVCRGTAGDRMARFEERPMTSLTSTLSEMQRDQQPDQYRQGFHRPPDESGRMANVGPGERLCAAAAGAALGVASLMGRRTSLAGLAGAAVLLGRAATGYCPVYHVLGIDRTRPAGRPAPAEEYYERSIHVEESITIDRPAQELFDFWRDFTNLPKFMDNLVSVTCIPGGRSHWVAKGPAGMNVEWDAEMINEEPGRLIAWRSLSAEVDNSGSVRFAEGPRGTTVRVVLNYIPPAGKLGAAVARLFGDDPKSQIREDLRRLKQLMETGDVPMTAGQPRGSCTS